MSIAVLRLRRGTASVALALLVWTLPNLEAAAQTGEQKLYSPYVGRHFPTNVYFGDTHLHTRLSLDAYGDGNTRNGPSEAYRWAKGETLAGDDGGATRISRPLDFLMVADHSEIDSRHSANRDTGTLPKSSPVLPMVRALHRT